jgi:hypothetical protein
MTALRVVEDEPTNTEDEGRCTSCGARIILPGHTSCDRCAEREVFPDLLADLKRHYGALPDTSLTKPLVGRMIGFIDGQVGRRRGAS